MIAQIAGRAGCSIRNILPPKRSNRRRRASRMFRQIRVMFLRIAFWLPFASDLLMALPDEVDRNALRRHVWRQIFRSRRYWWLVGFQLIGTPLLLFAANRAMYVWDPNAHRKPALVVLVNTGVITGWGVATTLVGLGPLRPTIRRHALGFLAQRGLRVCAACGYDLRGSTRDCCPECGAAINADNGNTDTRSRSG